MTRKNTARIKSAAVAHPVPQTREDVVDAIARIGEAQRERDRIQADMNDALAKLREQYEDRARPFADRITELSRGVQLYCEAHRDELTNNGKTKTHAFSSGEVRWRMRPPSVAIRAADVVIDTLKALGLGRFVRTKEEINKEAILADADAVAGIKGVTITQKEDFVVVPWDTELEQVV
jgi:phage host-nuclease inhibitor protein Gam